MLIMTKWGLHHKIERQKINNNNKIITIIIIIIIIIQKKHWNIIIVKINTSLTMEFWGCVCRIF
jgi:hypothetical protein